MYISKKIEVSWSLEEERKIKDFRLFLQKTAAKVKDPLPLLYEKLNTVNQLLADIVYQPFDEDFNLDTEEDE